MMMLRPGLSLPRLRGFSVGSYCFRSCHCFPFEGREGLVATASILKLGNFISPLQHGLSPRELITRPELPWTLKLQRQALLDIGLPRPLSRAKFSLPDWYQPAFSLAPATSPLLRLGRGWVLRSWKMWMYGQSSGGAKPRRSFSTLFAQARSNFAHIEKLWTVRRPHSSCILRDAPARMMALGIILGLQFGSQIGSKVEGTIAASISGHASVARLLVEEPRASSLDVCRALDKVNEPLPWLKLSRVSRFW